MVSKVFSVAFRSRLIGFAGASVLALSLASCGKKDDAAATAPKAAEPAPVEITKDNQRLLIPLATGNTWTYDLEINNSSQGQAARVTKAELKYTVNNTVAEGADGTKAILFVERDGEKTDEQVWFKDSTGIFQLALTTKRIPYEPKQPLIKFPVVTDQELKWEGKGLTPAGTPGKIFSTYTTGAVEQVDTGAGPFNALAVRSESTFITKGRDQTGKEFDVQGKAESSTWYAPNVGIVRYRQTMELPGARTVITLRLRNYNVAK